MTKPYGSDYTRKKENYGQSPDVLSLRAMKNKKRDDKKTTLT
jgi:hypothetical protein